MAWEIWQHKNRELFERRQFDFMEVIEKGQRRWGEIQELEGREIACNQHTSKVQKWVKPAHGQNKLNCDVAVGKEGRIGLAFVLQDHQGEVILAGKTEIQAGGSTATLEGMAMRYALQVTQQYKMKADQIECDNKTFIEFLDGKMRPEVYCDVIVNDVCKLMAKVGCEKASYISRKANNAAHDLAHGPNCISIRHIPENIATAVARDVME